MKDKTDADYMHVKRVCKDFEIKNLGKYHDLHAKSETLRLADVSENFSLRLLNSPSELPFNSIFPIVSQLEFPKLVWENFFQKPSNKSLVFNVDYRALYQLLIW